MQIEVYRVPDPGAFTPSEALSPEDALAAKREHSRLKSHAQVDPWTFRAMGRESLKYFRSEHVLRRNLERICGPGVPLPQERAAMKAAALSGEPAASFLADLDKLRAFVASNEAEFRAEEMRIAEIEESDEGCRFLVDGCQVALKSWADLAADLGRPAGHPARLGSLRGEARRQLLMWVFLTRGKLHPDPAFGARLLAASRRHSVQPVRKNG